MTDNFLIEPSDLKAKYQKSSIAFIDVRDPQVYAESHIPGAINIPEIFTYLASSSDMGIQELQKTFSDKFSKAGLSGQELVVVYEDAMDKGLGSSCRGYLILKYLGYPKVSVLHGGLLSWKNCGLPITTEVGQNVEKDFPIDIDSSVLATTEQVLESLSDRTVVKLDVRSSQEWEGLSSSPKVIDFCPRKGRIPGAVWIDWSLFIDSNTTIPLMKSNAEILSICGEAGINRDSTVYIYCFKGARAASSFVAMKKAGIQNVKVYLASWNEWSRDKSLPIEEGMPSLHV